MTEPGVELAAPGGLFFGPALPGQSCRPAYSYGDEITSTSNDREKFATYTRDTYTGLDYAGNRYYASTYGRFNTADPFRQSAHLGNPASWDRYVYSLDDPINRGDPSGLDSCLATFLTTLSLNTPQCQVAGNAVLQGTAAGMGLTALAGGEVGTSGASTAITAILAPGLVGQATGAVLQFTGSAITDNPGLVNLGNQIATTSSPLGALATAIWKNFDTGALANDTGTFVLSLSQIGLSYLSGSSPSPADIAALIAAASNHFAPVMPSGPVGPVVEETPPVTVTATQDPVAYAPTDISIPDLPNQLNFCGAGVGDDGGCYGLN
jgi:RHS repeat-associated protein